MIRLIFESIGEIVPEWENDNERLIFRLPSATVQRGSALHEQMEEAGVSVPASEPMGMVTLRYEGDVAHEVHLVLELPDAVWDNLANCADDLLDEDFLPDEDDEDLFDEEGWEGVY